jgi:hypothetical protein
VKIPSRGNQDHKSKQSHEAGLHGSNIGFFVLQDCLACGCKPLTTSRYYLDCI